MNAGVSTLKRYEDGLKGHQQSVALDEIARDFDNIKEAWRRAVERNNPVAIDAMIEGMYWFCWMRGQFNVLQNLFELAREKFVPDSDEEPHPVLARLIARYPGDDPESKLELALRVAEQQGDRHEIAWCLNALGRTARRNREWQRCITFYEQSRTIYVELGDKFYEARVLRELAGAYQFMGLPDRSIEYAGQSAQLSGEIGDVDGTISSTGSLGITSFMIGRYAEAKRYWAEVHAQRFPKMKSFSQSWSSLLQLIEGDIKGAKSIAFEALTTARDIGDIDSENIALVTLAMVATLNKDFETSAQILGSTEFIRGARVFSSWVKAASACDANSYETATEYILSGLEYAAVFNSPAWKSLYLPVGVVAIALYGNTEQAAEIIGLMSTAPISANKWEEKWELYSYVRQRIESELGKSAYDEALKRGKSRDLDGTIQRLSTDLINRHG